MGHFHSVKDGPCDKVMWGRHTHVLNLETAICKHLIPDGGELPSISLVSLKLLDVLSFCPLRLGPCRRYIPEQQQCIISSLPFPSSFSYVKTDQGPS